MDKNNLPKHLGIVMDGNGRWAKLRNLPRQMGHKAGAKVFKDIMTYCGNIGIKYVTVYAFSTENWKRPEAEINAILTLLKEYLEDSKNYYKDNIKYNIIGDLTVFSEEIRNAIKKAMDDTDKNDGMYLNVAVNYGGRNEIINAVKNIITDYEDNKINIDDINENSFKNYLYTKNQPDVDLVIRPSGECRLSNFLIYQCAYAEFVFMDTLWPDFSTKQLDKALTEFAKRDRRFGGV